MNKLLVTLMLAIIILIAAVTRFYKLGEVPAGLYIDEAGQGYSAYSILLTGKDEFGMPYPAVFRSFTDFKTPVYIYLVAPLIPYFDLTPFTVRFPSFFFSILTIPVLFLLIRKITQEKVSLHLAWVSFFLLAISPWHILFGRTNFECNVALFFLISGIYTFYLGLKKPAFLILSCVLFAIAVPAYHSQRIITPLVVILLTLRHKNILFSKSYKKWVIVGVVSGIILTLPTLSVINTPGFLARASGLNIFSDSRVSAGYLENYSGFLAWLINSKWFLSIQEFLSLYFSYLSPRNMFVLGDYGPRSSFPELATYYIWQFPFYVYGLYILLKNKFGEFKFLVLALLFISPIPAAVTRDPYSTIRALPLVVPQIIIISIGIVFFVKYVHSLFVNHKIRKFFLPISTLVSLLVIIYSIGKLYSSAILLNEYFRAAEWDWGWKQVVETIKTFDSSTPIIVDNSREEAYIELAFFLKYDPSIYQKENNNLDLKNYYTDMNHNKLIRLGNITTRPIDWEKDLQIEQYLIGDGLAISEQQIERHNLEVIREIKYPNKSVAFRIVKVPPPKLQF